MSSKSPIKSYQRLSELYNDEDFGKDMLQDADFTIHRMETVHNQPVESPVFRANYFSFILIEQGRSFYTIDSHKFYTKPGTLYFTNPGHLKSFGIEEVCHGFLMTFSEEFLKVHLHNAVFDEFTFLLTELVPPCYLDEAKFSELQQLAEQIFAEEQKQSPLKHRIISSLIMVFLLKVKEYLLQDASFRVELDRESEIVNTFKKDLEARLRASDKIQPDLQVAAFAQAQQLHPTYFSTVIKAKTGQTANAWIQAKIVSEAQALLRRSTLSIKEIAYQLGFNEPTHFSRFFKKQVGQSPGQFRKSQ